MKRPVPSPAEAHHGDLAARQGLVQPSLTLDNRVFLGCTLATPRDDARRGPQVAIRSKGAAAMTERLAARGVVVSLREDKVRAVSMPTTTASTSTPWWKRSPPTGTCWRDISFVAGTLKPRAGLQKSYTRRRMVEYRQMVRSA
jgi:hypothetical protein